VRAADSARGVNCLTIIYPAGDGLHFNADYYRDHHLKTIMKLYTSSIHRFELRTVPAAPAGGPPGPKYAAAVNIWINDLAAFGANNEKHGKTLQDDVKNFTNGMPTIQFDTVEGEMGVYPMHIPLITEIKPGPKNPLGKYFIALSGGGVGFHGTNSLPTTEREGTQTRPYQGSSTQRPYGSRCGENSCTARC